jgi:HD-GYP domain-containing protein (c-di-GMP phosphodiesterase class II)
MGSNPINLSGKPSVEASAIASKVLDNLAARFRPSGLFLAMAGPDGAITYGDSLNGLLFLRFALPLLQYGDPSCPDLPEKLRGVNAGTPLSAYSGVPGVMVALVPCAERRHVQGTLLLVARKADFELNEDVKRVCSRLGLDGNWLLQEARNLPAYTEEGLLKQARLLTGILRDQMQLNCLQNEMDSLSGQLANTYEELTLIYQISSGMRINRRANEFFKQACLDVLDVVGVKGMGVALNTDNNHRQEPVLYGALSLPPGVVHQLARQLLPVLCQRKSPLLINDLAKDRTFSNLGEYAHQLLAVPLQRQEVVLGCLFALDKLSGDFDSQDSKLLSSIANESAIYLENVNLFEDMQDLNMGLLHSLTSAVDAKDAYTCGHSERVAMLARQVTIEAGITEIAPERIYMAGLLHDVGKIGVPESVLQKTGRLTPEEFDQMKKHPQIGGRILRDIKQIRDIIPGVLYHHERYDGRGYPEGRIGEDIPIMGRIICLADCFDAMTSNRTYRKALPLEVAMTEIRRCSGTQFDPGLTEAFLRIGAENFRKLLQTQQGNGGQLPDLQRMLHAA